MTSSRLLRGRPPLADVEELRSRALREIERVGYADASMAMLAQKVGVSVRTLHRYFPSKPEIVWGGIASPVEALREALDDVDDGLGTFDALSAAISGVFALDAGDLATMRARLRLIALSPELRASGSLAFDGWRDAIIEFVARRDGEPAAGLVPAAVGAAVQAAVMEALTWWAASDDDRDAADCVAEALQGLRGLLQE